MDLPSDAELMALPKRVVIDLLVGIIRTQAAQIEELRVRVASLEQQLRDKNGPGAPFSKGKRKANPKLPGRRAGQGAFKHRPAPEPTSSDIVTEVDASLGIDQRHCPECAVPLETRQEVATIEDLPKQPVRHITRIHVEVGRCPICGKTLRASHSLLGKHQSGATEHQLGPRIKAMALALHYQQGVPMRRVPSILEQSTGIKVTQGAINQLACSLSAPGAIMDEAYTQLQEELATSSAVHTDDTGWRINGVSAYLMGFFTRQIAYFQIRFTHRHQEVIEALGPAFAGWLITDRGCSYRAVALYEWLMQKCLAHLLKNCSQVHATKRTRGREFSAQLMALLRESIALWHRVVDPNDPLEQGPDYMSQVRSLEQRLEEHLRPRRLPDEDNQRLLEGIGEVFRDGQLTQFLHYPDLLEPTNNRAERGLRPAVIARKVSQCSKTERGSRAYATLKSIFCTLALRTNDVLGAFTDLLQGKPLVPAR